MIVLSPFICRPRSRIDLALGLTFSSEIASSPNCTGLDSLNVTASSMGLHLLGADAVEDYLDVPLFRADLAVPRVPGAAQDDRLAVGEGERDRGVRRGQEGVQVEVAAIGDLALDVRD